MKRLIALSLFAWPLLAFSQNRLPDYRTVVSRFFSLYHHDNKPEEMLDFARKKDGWYVQVSNATKAERPVSQQLFWSLQKGRYQVLENFVGANTDPLEYKVLSHIYQAGYNGYGYARCIYYGYDGWDADIIKDYGQSSNLNDTLLESLARAYAANASRYLWYQYGSYALNDDTLQRRLGRLEMPGDERVKKAAENLSKAVSTYEKIKTRNNTYETFVGNIELKCFNESYHGYLQMILCNRPQEARKFLDACRLPKNDSMAAQNLLQSVGANAIFFTGGDIDTYPLLYLQDKHNIRKDVTIINTSLLQLPVYVDMLKRKNEVSFSSASAEYGKTDFDIIYWTTENYTGKKKKLKDFITGHKNLLRVPATGMDSVKVFNDKYLYAILNKNTDTLQIELRGYLMMNEFIVLDIVETNLNKRPIYFHSDLTSISSRNLRSSGLVEQIVAAADNEHFLAPGFEEYMRTKYKAPFVNTITSFSENNANIDGHFKLYTPLIRYKLALGEKRAADSLIDASLAPFGNYTPLIRNVDSLASAMYKAGRGELADKLCKKVAGHWVKYDAEESFGRHYAKEQVIMRLEELKQLMARYNRDATIIDDAINRLSRD